MTPATGSTAPAAKAEGHRRVAIEVDLAAVEAGTFILLGRPAGDAHDRIEIGSRGRKPRSVLYAITRDAMVASTSKLP